MEKKATRNSVLMILALICTVTVIGTNYIFTQQMVTDISEKLIENEYDKIGGKENYIIMQEIQKREILSYIDKVRKEQPELIKEILEKSKNNKPIEYKYLSENIINDLKKDTYIQGNSGALISMIEFSDLECPFCIKQHNNGTNKEIIESSSGTINYVFKNFPIPAHKNANIESQAAKCVEKLDGGEKYLEYIDNIFKNTEGGGEGFPIEELLPLAENLGINKADFEKCMMDGVTKTSVEKEFKQGVMLGISSVPSTLIVNNETGKYIIVTQAVETEKLKEIISEISE